MKTCFVVMGFEEKEDLQPNPNRKLNLNSTFDHIIKPAIKAAGLACIRADEFVHSGVIDKRMYEHLLNADVVVADLSTTNPNAIYELGVRHALRPWTTIVMAENNFSAPFDLKSVNTLRYRHSGDDIFYAEVVRVQGELTDKLKMLAEQSEVDSPVYVFLPTLTRAEARTSKEGDAAPMPPAEDKDVAYLMNTFRQSKAKAKTPSEWHGPKAILNLLREKRSQDPYILQQLALATYKSEPDNSTALQEAMTLLKQLSAATSTELETIGLWGAVHEKIWQIGHDRGDLEEAIGAYERGYVLQNDYGCGINYSFVLNVRASLSIGDEAIADGVFARRVRARVLRSCDARLEARDFPPDEAFQIGATKVEALLGLDNRNEADSLKALVIDEERERLRARGEDPKEADSKEQALDQRLERLQKLLAAINRSNS